MLKLSKNKALLLRLFFTNPENAFYIQEIGRILGKKPGIFQRTLYAMEKSGLLVSEKVANARYFRVNTNYPLYEEYKNIVNKTIGVLGSIREILGKAGSVEYAFLYGSYAKNKENSLSDIDLVIIGSPDENRILRDLGELERTLRREINYKLYTGKEYSQYIMKRNPFLLAITNDQKIMLVGEENGLRKIVEGSSHQETDGGPGADTKPATSSHTRFKDRRVRHFH